MPSAPPRRIGRYALYSEIAAGGMATVHIGRLLGPVGFSRTVAIKRLHSMYAKDPEFVSMFLDEARLAARIRHPHVVSTIDVVATGGELFVVMDYVQGESLSQIARRLKANGQRMPPRIVASIMSGVLRGLHAAHEAKDERGLHLGIVHRDVSPQNVIVGVDGLARVLDFGIAKASVRLGTTREGQIKGKLSYMAPEQLRADSVSPAADIYAASVVLWELLTGTKLFHGDTEASVLARVLEGEVAPPSTIATDLPTAFDEVTLKGLAKSVSRRYASGREMALDLEKCAGTASAAEVSDWLELTVGDTLSKRACTVAEIEADSGTLSNVNEALAELSQKSAPPAAPNHVVVHVGAATPGPDFRSATTVPVEFRPVRAHADGRGTHSAVSLANDLPPPRAPKRGWGLALGAIAVVGVCLATVVIMQRRPTTSTHAGDVAGLHEQAPTAALLVTTPATPTAPLATAAAPEDSRSVATAEALPAPPLSTSAIPSATPPPRVVVRAVPSVHPDPRPQAGSTRPAKGSAFDGLGGRQ